jgi:PilZ domain
MTGTLLRPRRAKSTCSNLSTFRQPSAELAALLNSGDRAQSVTIRSISREGMTVEYARGLQPGDAVRVQLFSNRTLMGAVRWSLAAYCGIAFTAPLAEDDPVLLSQY